MVANVNDCLRPHSPELVDIDQLLDSAGVAPKSSRQKSAGYPAGGDGIFAPLLADPPLDPPTHQPPYERIRRHRRHVSDPEVLRRSFDPAVSEMAAFSVRSCMLPCRPPRSLAARACNPPQSSYQEYPRAPQPMLAFYHGLLMEQDGASSDVGPEVRSR